MALFKKKGDNLSRAGAILDALATKTPPVVEGADTPPVVEGADTPPVIETPPVVETPTDDTIIETPPVETPPADGVDTPPVVEGVATPPVADVVDTPPVVETPTVAEITEEAIFTKLSEMLGKEVKSADDLKVETPQVSPEVQQLLDWQEKTGLPLSEWSNYNRDFSKLSDMDVAREILAKQYPSFTAEELAYSLKNYVYDEGIDDEGDKIKKSIDLKKFAKEGRDQLEANRLELTSSTPQAVLTQEQTDAIAFAQQVQAQNVDAQANADAYTQGIANASNSLDSIDLKLSDDLTIKYNVPDEVKQGLPKVVAEMPHWYNSDGSFNHENVVKDVAKVTNFEAMVKAAYAQGVAVGKEGQIKVGANITIDGTVPQTTSTPSKGNALDVVNKITNSKTGGKLRFRTKKT